MKRILTTAITIALATAAFAQGADDACLYSQTYYQGTAKAMGMGNALGAVGGDMTSICINPAGMGIYRSNELTATFDLLDNFQQSTYYGTGNNANQMRLTIPNIGWVNAKQRSNYRPLRFTQFGIGLTRTNDFNIHSFAKGLNPNSSKIHNENFFSQIDGLSPDDLPNDAYSYWRTYLIDDHHDGQSYYYTSNVPEGNVWQSADNQFKGRSEEWSFTGSANFHDCLFVGLSVNLAHIKRVGTRTFEESRPNDVNTDFKNWNYSESIKSNAMGFNAKIGFIYLANSWLRIGGAFHSPTVYGFDESWQTITESDFVMSGFHSYTSEESNYEYTFIKPLKWVGSMAFLIGEQGLVSLDVEYTNFGAARFKANDYDYGNVNENIKATYGKTLNLRIGSEWMVGNSYLRIGAAYYGSPFGLGQVGGSVKTASCGISVPVSQSTTFDFAYELAYGKSYANLYDVADLESITYKQFKNNIAATLKVKF